MRLHVRASSIHDPVDTAAAWVVRLSEDDPSAAERAEFQKWLEDDPGNRAAFVRAFDAWHGMDDAATEPWLVGLMADAQVDSRRRLRRQPIRIRLLAATCLILALFVGGAVWWYATSPVIYATGIGEQRVVQLSDGSQISLDADTRVKVVYTKDRRWLRLLQGRVACEVAKDPLRPFSVRAANKVVVATGTEFSVELVANQVHVVLYRGHVAVLDVDGGTAHAKPVRLLGRPGAADSKLVPGRELVVPARTDAARVSQVDPSQSLAWERGLLYFNSVPLNAAVQRINRYSRKPIAIGSAAAAQMRISGVFEAGDTAAFVSGVTAVFPIRVVDRNGTKTLELRSP